MIRHDGEGCQCSHGSAAAGNEDIQEKLPLPRALAAGFECIDPSLSVVTFGLTKIRVFPHGLQLDGLFGVNLSLSLSSVGLKNRGFFLLKA